MRVLNITLVAVLCFLLSACEPPVGEVSYDLGDGIVLEMVRVPGGSFQMGASPTEKGSYKRECPKTKVKLGGFQIGKFEVTQEQYRAVMGVNPSGLKGDRRPVESVTWDDAATFCRKLSKRIGQVVTLPTEAQWEYACRAKTKGPFAFGDCLQTTDANYDGNRPLKGCSKGTYRRTTWEVGSGRANAWGLYDMHGNVMEWCQDWYEEYSPGSKRNPMGPDLGSTRVRRGGSYFADARSCRSAFRLGLSPDFSSIRLGFRVIISTINGGSN